MRQAPWFKATIRLLSIVATAGVMIALAPRVFAQVGQPPSIEAVSARTDEVYLAVNAMWMLVAAILVFFMQLGFAFVETGLTRAKNVAHTMGMNLMVFCIGALGYWLCGFAFQFGSVNYAWPSVNTSGAIFGAWAHSPVTLGDWGELLARPLIKIGDQIGILGGSGFMLAGITMNVGVLTFFMYQTVFMNIAATIPTGAMAERLKFSGFCLMALFVSMVVYPLIGNWVWGGGWLQNLGRIAGLGNGAVDFAGSGVVHMVGGTIALAGIIVLGPRIGRFNQDGSVNQIPGHNIPMGIAGAIILFFGWFGFNAGSSFGFTGSFGQLAANAAVNTLVSGSAGGVAAMCYMWWLSPVKKPDPIMAVNGLLGGCVAITTSCAFVDSAGAVIIGIIAGVLVCMSTGWLESVNIDDAAGAVPVHLVCGAWGLMALGIFAIGDPITRGWNGMDNPVTGILYGSATTSNIWSQLLAQMIEVAAIFVTVFTLMFVFFKVLQTIGLLRATRESELKGLDMTEMGMNGYVNDHLFNSFEPQMSMQQQPALAPANPFGNYNTPTWNSPAAEPGFGQTGGGYGNTWNSPYQQPQQPASRNYPPANAAGYGQQDSWAPQQPPPASAPRYGQNDRSAPNPDRWSAQYQQPPPQRYPPQNPPDSAPWNAPGSDVGSAPPWGGADPSAYRYGQTQPGGEVDYPETAPAWGRPTRPASNPPNRGVNNIDDIRGPIPNTMGGALNNPDIEDDEPTWGEQQQDNGQNDWYAADSTPNGEDDPR